MATVTVRRRVEWGETDAAGIVFYPNYYRWFDQATHDLFRAVGSPVLDHLAGGHVIPLIETSARFHAALAYDDSVEITSTVTEIRSRAFVVEHRVIRDGDLICEGREVRIWAIVGADGRSVEPKRIPDHVRHLLQGDRMGAQDDEEAAR